MNFTFYQKSDFEKKTISSRLMTSHQMSSLKNKQFFENVENVLKLTVDKFYDKLLSCLISRIVVWY